MSDQADDALAYGAGGGGVAGDGIADKQLTIEGSLLALNAALATVTYQSALDYNSGTPTPVPDQVTVVGTVNINLCVAVNPRSLESGGVQWFTMATRIRPLNLSAAVNVAQQGGFRFLPQQPAGLPMN